MKIYDEPLAISADQWLSMLNDRSVFHEEDVELIRTLYYFPDCRASGKELARVLNKASHSPFNAQIGRLGKRIVRKHPDVQFPMEKGGKIRWWHIPFLGEEHPGRYTWQLRSELCEAVRRYEQQDIDRQEDALLPSELEDVALREGGKKLVAVNRYERNARARRLCLQKYGYRCVVCQFDFEEVYGEIGKGFIEVHHLIPLSEIGEQYTVNPFDDLRPVCPNCHAMLHRGNLSIEELQRIVEARRTISVAHEPN
ncbi:HNH endonuclease [Geobacillus sp. C56-T3]|uniref:HNH endonuclease n=1 Tax=Geobacillus sp. (strain C56-T3) TaxID=691437 RepID=UPI0001D58747|nr:HNH endonuclease [Geobacillus sp. C56-T3]ADI27621.1 HNH endonuclease [Geobacillus sp. C56-T3]